MPDYQIITCPDCGGKGCPTCNKTGKVKVAQEQMQKLKQMVGQANPATTAFTPPSEPSLSVNPKFKTNLSAIIAFSLLSILAGAAAASWYFLKTFKPFFGGLVGILVVIGSYLASKQSFFKLQEPKDYLSAIKKLL